MKPSTQKLGTLSTGQEVYDRFNSHLHESVTPLLQEAFAKIKTANEGFIKRQVDFERIVGQTTCVETTAQDSIIFAQRPGRQGLTRFVQNRQPVDCDSVVVILKKGDGYYVLIAAFIGKSPEPEPWDPNLIGTEAIARAKQFWSSHALVWGEEETIPGTETTQCPW